jgi:hypothetical protein
LHQRITVVEENRPFNESTIAGARGNLCSHLVAWLPDQRFGAGSDAAPPPRQAEHNRVSTA